MSTIRSIPPYCSGGTGISGSTVIAIRIAFSFQGRCTGRASGASPLWPGQPTEQSGPAPRQPAPITRAKREKLRPARLRENDEAVGEYATGTEIGGRGADGGAGSSKVRDEKEIK